MQEIRPMEVIPPEMPDVDGIEMEEVVEGPTDAYQAQLVTEKAKKISSAQEVLKSAQSDSKVIKSALKPGRGRGKGRGKGRGRGATATPPIDPNPEATGGALPEPTGDSKPEPGPLTPALAVEPIPEPGAAVAKRKPRGVKPAPKAEPAAAPAVESTPAVASTPAVGPTPAEPTPAVESQPQPAVDSKAGESKPDAPDGDAKKGRNHMTPEQLTAMWKEKVTWNKLVCCCFVAKTQLWLICGHVRHDILAFCRLVPILG